MPPNEVRLEPAVVTHSHAHDSARLHVSGAAAYIDDIREPSGTLHLACGLSPKARGHVASLDLAAVRESPGVVAVLTAKDIPGANDIAPVFADEPLLAGDSVMFHGQPLFAVVAETRDAARRAARLAKVEIAEEAPVLTIEEALAAESRVLPDYAFGRGIQGRRLLPRRIVWQANSRLAGRSISIWKAWRRWRCRARPAR